MERIITKQRRSLGKIGIDHFGDLSESAQERFLRERYISIARNLYKFTLQEANLAGNPHAQKLDIEKTITNIEQLLSDEDVAPHIKRTFDAGMCHEIAEYMGYEPGKRISFVGAAGLSYLMENDPEHDPKYEAVLRGVLEHARDVDPITRQVLESKSFVKAYPQIALEPATIS